MAEKAMQKEQKMMAKGHQNGNQNPSKIEQVIKKKACQKQCRISKPKKIRVCQILNGK